MRWPLVEIKWLDSCGPHGWSGLRQAMTDELAHCVSVGYLVRDEATIKTVIAHFVLHDNDFLSSNVDGVLHIPTVAVTSCRIIEPATEAA